MIAIDTNVLIYAVDDAEPTKSAQAEDLLRNLASGGDSLVVPWQVAVEFLACLRRWENAGKISRADLDDYLTRFIEPLPIVFPASACLRQSLELSTRYSLSHWDSLLIAACITAGITTLYSEDMDDGMTYDTVTITNPYST